MDIENHYNNTPITHATLFGKQDTDVEEVTQQKHIQSTLSKNEILDTIKKMGKEITLEDASSLLPEGKEKVFLILYFFLLPYISGLIFLFTYIAEVDFNLFISMLDDHSYFLTWCIGYEILMFITLSTLTIKNLMIMRKKKYKYIKTKNSIMYHFYSPIPLPNTHLYTN